MAQFDVHRNPGRNRVAIPFVVIVQSRRFDAHARRLVAPLLAATMPEASHYPELAPRFRIEGQEVVLDPLQLQTVPREVLGPVVASLADDAVSGRIIAAIDIVLSTSAG
ncbi:CcdB family protein [Plastoroseomonas hellenica]|uniref:CcdB family protein n=1 Tax=Plastoroseomonas hellenica TaxID=2687306 RepID=UPI001BA9E2A9|nr:CcdB family protein [Plastoroseomonas hellenica]MBR0646676.1 plasmid maintenance protein CcdB [Plastoroseomonas hellenica]